MPQLYSSCENRQAVRKFWPLQLLSPPGKELVTGSGPCPCSFLRPRPRALVGRLHPALQITASPRGPVLTFNLPRYHRPDC